MAHPDDAEQFFGGTALLLTNSGHTVTFIAFTDGRYGSETGDDEHVAQMREKEAHIGAVTLGANYTNLGFADNHLVADNETISAVEKIIREKKPDIIITHPPHDYHPDHEITAEIIKKAIWRSRLTNTPNAHLQHIAFYYTDPEGAILPSGQFAPVSDVVKLEPPVFQKKMHAFTSHISQMGTCEKGSLTHEERTERIAIARGLLAGNNVLYGEAFRQDLSFGFSRHNLLEELLPHEVVRLSA